MIPTLQLGQFGRGRIASAVATDPDFASVSLLMHCNGTNGSTTFVDSSSLAHALTANGNVQLSTAQVKFGSAAALFDGTGDYVSSPNHASFNIEAGDFTLEAWVYRAASGVSHYLLSKRSATFTNGWEWRINASNTLQYFHTGGTSLTSSGTVPSGQWVFLQTTRSGNTVSHFIDGVASGTNASFTNGTINIADTIKVGVANDLGSGFNGYMDDIRITKGVARSNAVPSAQFPDS
jgi:hypothetical protein